MTERELLELAAKAAGIDLGWWAEELHAFWMGQTGDAVWNPLADDGDALRLMVKLDLNVFQAAQSAFALPSDEDDATFERQVRYIDTGGDVLAATRRAIVRAAAEIARAMP